MGRRKVTRKKNGKVTTIHLVRDLSEATGVAAQDVRLVLNALGPTALKYMVQNMDVRIDGFGVFHPQVRKRMGEVRNLTTFKGTKKKVVAHEAFRVSFSKAYTFKEKLRMAQEDEGMDKFAVDETAGVSSASLEKRASEGCPVCGKTPTRHGNTLVCPKCGTEPFERA